MVSLKAGSPAKLDAYAHGIHRLSVRYPGEQNWGFISCADATLREEVWQAKMEKLKEDGLWPSYMPWAHVLDITAFGSDNIASGMDRWWDDHVIHPCTQARNGRSFLSELEGTALQPFPHGMAPARAANNQMGGGSSSNKRKRAPEIQPQNQPHRARIWDARPKNDPNKGWGKGGGKGGKGGHGKGGYGKGGQDAGGWSKRKNKDAGGWGKGGDKPEPRK